MEFVLLMILGVLLWGRTIACQKADADPCMLSLRVKLNDSGYLETMTLWFRNQTKNNLIYEEQTIIVVAVDYISLRY